MSMTMLATAEPIEGAERAVGTIEPDSMSQMPLHLLGGEPTEVYVKAEGGEIHCGLFKTDGEALIVDENDDNECAFTVTPKYTADVILAVGNVGDKPALVVIIVR